jgi:glycosyltransferase involved in cell wall biosynthesis
MVDDMVTIITTTYFSKEHRGRERMNTALGSVRSWGRLETDFLIHIADDGSDSDLWDEFMSDIKPWNRVTTSRQQRRGIGASLNAGLAQAWANGGLALYIVDDMKLEGPLDLSFPANVLNHNEDIMAVRIGLPHPDTTGRVRHFAGEHQYESYMLELDPHHYVMTHRPFMAHQRMTYLGPYLEGVHSGDCEREFNERYLRDPKLKVMQWIPNIWNHNSDVELGYIALKGEQ